MAKEKESKVISILRNFDQNSMPVGLRLKGELETRTITGALLSLLSLFAALAFSSSTFLDWINLTNPKITVGSEFSTKGEGQQSSKASINFTDANFYMSVSFYNPKSSNISSFQFNDNNYSFVEYINQLNISCTTCAEENTKTRMNLCNDKDFDLINLKSMSKFKSDRIIGIFKKYSFCFPTGFNGTIEDLDGPISKDNFSFNVNNNSKNGADSSGSSIKGNGNGSNNKDLNVSEMSNGSSGKYIVDDEVITAGNGFVQDSSLTIFIPFSKKNINQTNVNKNTQPRNTDTQIFKTSSGSTNGASIQNYQTAPAPAPAPVPKPSQQPVNNTNPNSNQNPNLNQNPYSNQNPNSNQNPISNQNPNSITNPNQTPTQNSLPSGSQTSSQQPKTSGTQPSGATPQTQPKPSGTINSSATSSTQTSPPPPSRSPPPISTLNSTPDSDANQRKKPAPKNNSTNKTTFTNNSNKNKNKNNIYNQNNKNKKETKRTLQMQKSSTLNSNNSATGSDQQSTSLSLNTNDASDDIQSIQVNAAMLEIINQFRFPKILLMDKDYQINPNAKPNKNQPIIEFIYNLNILDYRDRLTGNPISYDVFIQEAIVEVVQPKFLWTETETKKVLRVFKIEENSLNSNLNSGATISFKSVAEVPKITITFVSFNDFLSAFGSFSTVFAMLSLTLSGFYNEIVLNASIINSVFKFIENTEDDIKRVKLGDEYEILRRNLIGTSNSNFNNNNSNRIFNSKKGNLKSHSIDNKDNKENSDCVDFHECYNNIYNNKFDNIHENRKSQENNFYCEKENKINSKRINYYYNNNNTKEKIDEFKNIEMQDFDPNETPRSYNKLNPIFLPAANEKDNSNNNINNTNNAGNQAKPDYKNSVSFVSNNNFKISNISNNQRDYSIYDLLFNININNSNLRMNCNNNYLNEYYNEVKNLKQPEKSFIFNQDFINENICFIEPKKACGVEELKIPKTKKDEKQIFAEIEEKKANEIEEVKLYK